MDEAETEESRWRLSRYAPPEPTTHVFDENPDRVPIKPATGECPHDLAERETACADGMCPICANAALAAAYDFTKFHGVAELRAQLAAEREKVQTLTDALLEVELYRHSWDTTHPCSLVADIAKDALAKVK